MIIPKVYTKDTVGKNYSIFYTDKECTEFYCKFLKDYSNCPVKNKSKKVILNCIVYSIIWV